MKIDLLDWHWQLHAAIRTLSELEESLNLNPGTLTYLKPALDRYPMLIPPYYLGLIDSAHWQNDPIFLQSVPDLKELDDQSGAPDALDECGKSPVPRLVHRYPDRALFLTGNACAMHCRHCMRKRNWEIPLPPPNDMELEKCVDYVRHHSEIREILISGGDPFMLTNDGLERVLSAFASVEHVEMLRIGTRVPVVLPMRVTSDLCEMLGRCTKTVWVATHFNHPAELTSQAADAAARLVKAGIPLVNQSVLLKGINDDAEILRKLFTGLLKIKIKPYYLFHGDPIQGTMHFRTGVQRGLELMNQLRGKVSGMALPAFSFDLPMGAGKVRLQPEQALRFAPSGNPVFTSYEGNEVEYF